VTDTSIQPNWDAWKPPTRRRRLRRSIQRLRYRVRGIPALTDDPRTNTVIIGNVFEAYAAQFLYSEAADRAEIWDLTWPELCARLMQGETITGDCSSTYESTRKDAGCINLPPLGFTGTELDTMSHIEIPATLDGDAFVFGAYPGLHIVWKTGGSATNPTIDSHGQPGFQQTTLQAMWDSVFPGQPVTALSLAPFLPKPPPTPLEEDMIVAVADKNGNVHVFQETSDGTVYSSAQQTPGGPFATPFIIMKNGQKPS
jgi:hypothetical protein